MRGRHVEGHGDDAPRHVEAGVGLGADVGEHDHRQGEVRRLVGEGRDVVHRRVPRPRRGCVAGRGRAGGGRRRAGARPAAPSEARTGRRARARTTNSHSARWSWSRNEEQEREPDQADDGDADHHQVPAPGGHAPDVDDHRQRRRPTTMTANSSGPTDGVPVGQHARWPTEWRRAT